MDTESLFMPQPIYYVQDGLMRYNGNIYKFYHIIYELWLFSDIFIVYLSLYRFQ